MSEENPPGKQTREYLQEACYYLHKKGLTFEQLSKALEVPENEAVQLFSEYESRLALGSARENDVDRALWEDMYNDSIGN